MKPARKIKNAAIRLFPGLFGKKNTLGYVERIDPALIQGWAINFKGDPLRLTLHIDGKTFPLEPAWIGRSDVAEQHGKRYDKAGFRCSVPGEAAASLKKALREGRPLKVLAGDCALTIATRHAAPVFKLHQEPLGIRTSTADLHAELETWGHFTLRGWAEHAGHGAGGCSLECNGVPLECSLVRIERDEIARARHAEETDIGFEIELPGYLWEHVKAGEDARLVILADGRALNAEPILLSRGKAERWVEEIIKLPDDQERQYHAMIALEHMRFGGMEGVLSPQAYRFLRDFADSMGLDDYLEAAPSEAAGEDLGETLTARQHWKALRVLNERLAAAKTPEAMLNTLLAAMRQMKLKGEVRKRYLDSVVPVLCRHDVFARLNEPAEIGRWQQYEEAEDAWRLTLALPALMVHGHVPRATALLWKFARHLGRGWINAECIHFAVRELSRQSRDGRIGYKAAEEFRYAVIGSLDAFYGEWFSRLHDEELILAGLALLEDWPSYTDYFRRDLVKGLVRNHGLSPAFWRMLQERHAAFHDVELDRARGHWGTLQAAIEAGGEIHSRLAELVEPFRYFRHLKNYETDIVLRETIMHALPALNRELTPAGRALIGMLLDNPAEGLRIAAYPIAGENRLQEQFPECGDKLLAILHSLSPRPKSMFYEAQSEAGRLLREILEARDRGDMEALSARLDALRVHAPYLNDRPSGYLAADLLAFCYECQTDNGLEPAGDLEALSLVMQQAITGVKARTKTETEAEAEAEAEAEVDDARFLPAPMQAALARLAGRSRQDPLLPAFQAEMLHAIRKAFGDRYEALFKRPGKPAFAMPATGYPRDTLVVVYSCRKYLDSRIEAIRRTWIEDLKARAIPYLVLVGDGDDAIYGDMLALDVSDKYEDLPRKTLKLIDWVLDNTDFQYLYKIDDDCHLNVERFFDTLGYRKHFYYGRVIKRDVGGMDRAWHQSKSHTEHARKVLDKSPEPSIYADGGGGYSLSRQAMQALRETRQTVAGRRLLAVSLMEDKLVGDLLALADIQPSNEDYESYQRRRTFGEAVPVGNIENTFYPCRRTPTTMAHLDSADDFNRAQQIGQGSDIWPKKIWPTSWSPAIDANKNQLELLIPADKLEEILRPAVHVVAVVRNEITLLPHFLAHYRRLGVGSFLIADNLSDDGSREYLLQQADVALFSVDTEYKHSHYGVAWQQAMLGSLCLNKWVLLADADEFLIYPDCENRPLTEFIAEIEAGGCDCIRVDMIDMYPFGDLDEADFTRQTPFEAAPWFDRNPLQPWRLGSGFFSNAPALISNLRHRLDPAAEPNAFTSKKLALFRHKPWMRFSQGLHDAAETRLAQQAIWFAHFKYHSGFKRKVETEIRRGQHFDNAREYRRYAGMLAEGRGGFGTEGISQRYVDSGSYEQFQY